MCSKMDEQTEKREKVSSSNRRNNKPLMEKRRRQRINDCLVQLKGLVLQAMNKDTTQYSKLEKADILEMTVKHLKIVQRQHMATGIATDPNAISKYRAGFNDCASEIARYLDAVNGGNPDLKSRVMSYLSNSMMQFPVIPVYQGVVSPYHVQLTSPVTAQHGFPSSTFSQINANDVTRPLYPHPPHSAQQHSVATQGKHDLYSQQSRIPTPSKTEHSGYETSSPRVSSHMTSPSQRVPSPCDSDSGLSDSSTSFSHDENGNYSHFNVNNHSARHDMDSRLSGPTDLRKHPAEHYSTDSRLPQKRKFESNESLPPVKRVRVESTVQIARAPQPDTDDRMWRPW